MIAEGLKGHGFTKEDLEIRAPLVKSRGVLMKPPAPKHSAAKILHLREMGGAMNRDHFRTVYLPNSVDGSSLRWQV
jgi:acetamidase/formamidase